MKVLDRIVIILQSQKFERISDKISWWIVGIGFSYFFIRVMVSFLFDV